MAVHYDGGALPTALQARQAEYILERVSLDPSTLKIYC